MSGSSIYIGSSLKNGLLKQYTIFKDGIIPAYLVDLFNGNDALRGLVVSVDDLQEAKKAMQKKGTILNLYARRVRKEIK